MNIVPPGVTAMPGMPVVSCGPCPSGMVICLKRFPLLSNTPTLLNLKLEDIDIPPAVDVNAHDDAEHQLLVPFLDA